MLHKGDAVRQTLAGPREVGQARNTRMEWIGTTASKMWVQERCARACSCACCVRTFRGEPRDDVREP